MALFVGLIDNSWISAAQAATKPTSIQPVQVTSLQKGKYFSVNRITFSGGVSFDEHIINGPPSPPPGYDFQRSATTLPKPDTAAGIKTLTVPAFNWVFGCSSVSAAMIAGYYDRNGYSNIYTGPTNGGVMPLNNSSWSSWSDGYTTYPNLPLAASHQGVDGRVGRGSIDDYWVQYDSPANDPYIANGWAQHTWGDAIGDYMKTSQSGYSNTDGSTKFYNFTKSADPLTCSFMADPRVNISSRDGTYGRKLFYEARGYTVTDCYNQSTDNIIAGGFSFAQFKAEIDAGRPVLLNLAGHSIVGVGYNDLNQTVYIHDTWDYQNHVMTWGSSYLGMQLLSVSIVNLAPVSPTMTDLTINGPSTLNERSTALYIATASWSDGSTSIVTPDWIEDSSYTTMSSNGVLTASSVPHDQTVTVMASYTNGEVTLTDTYSVTVLNTVHDAMPWLWLLLKD